MDKLEGIVSKGFVIEGSFSDDDETRENTKRTKKCTKCHKNKSYRYFKSVYYHLNGGNVNYHMGSLLCKDCEQKLSIVKLREIRLQNLVKCYGERVCYGKVREKNV